jgi:ribosomal protein L28
MVQHKHWITRQTLEINCHKYAQITKENQNKELKEAGKPM